MSRKLMTHISVDPEMYATSFGVEHKVVLELSQPTTTALRTHYVYRRFIQNDTVGTGQWNQI